MLDRNLKTFLFAAALAAGAGGARAQDGAPARTGEANQGMGEEPAPALAPDARKEEQFFDPEMEVKRYDNILGLDDGQKAKVRKIFQDKLATFRSNAARRREIGEKTRKLHEQIMKLRGELEKAVKEQTLFEKNSFEKMRTVLRPDQLERFSAIEAQMDGQNQPTAPGNANPPPGKP